jgi:hypothetical protein
VKISFTLAKSKSPAKRVVLVADGLKDEIVVQESPIWWELIGHDCPFKKGQLSLELLPSYRKKLAALGKANKLKTVLTIVVCPPAYMGPLIVSGGFCDQRKA